jgi:hypothetical protein
MADDVAFQPTAQQYRERAQLLRSAVKKNLRTAEGRRRFLDIAQECEQLADGMADQAASQG